MKQKHLSATCTLNPTVLKLNGSEFPNLNCFRLYRNDFPVDGEVLNPVLFEICKTQVCPLTKKLQDDGSFQPSSVTTAAGTTEVFGDGQVIPQNYLPSTSQLQRDLHKNIFMTISINCSRVDQRKKRK